MCNFLGQLAAAHRLFALVHQVLATQHLHGGCLGTKLEQDRQRARAGLGLQINNAAHGQPGGVRAHVHHHGFEASGFKHVLQCFDPLPPRGRNQHIDAAWGDCARADFTKIEAHVLEGEGNVLFSLALDLVFHL